MPVIAKSFLIISGFPTSQSSLDKLVANLPWLNIRSIIVLDCTCDPEILRNRILANLDTGSDVEANRIQQRFLAYRSHTQPLGTSSDHLISDMI